MTRSDDIERDYDVCLSFAGEQREYVRAVADALRDQGVRVFYDDYEQVSLWGKDLYEHLDYIYRKAARYCILFASADYARKVWTTHERKSAQARALEENVEYVLPVRFDSTEIPGLRPTIVYVTVQHTTPEDLVSLIRGKLGPRRRQYFFPPEPDRLFAGLNADDESSRNAITRVALSFLQSLRRMTPNERVLVAHVFRYGCPADMPENMHMGLDVIRRDLQVPPVEIIHTLQAVRSLGFECETREGKDHDGNPVVVVCWNDMTAHYEDDDPDELEWASMRSMEVAEAMIRLAGDFCEQHGREQIEAMDFSRLSSATLEDHSH